MSASYVAVHDGVRVGIYGSLRAAMRDRRLPPRTQIWHGSEQVAWAMPWWFLPIPTDTQGVGSGGIPAWFGAGGANALGLTRATVRLCR